MIAERSEVECCEGQLCGHGTWVCTELSTAIATVSDPPRFLA